MKKNNVLIIVIVLIIVMITGVVGFYLYSKNMTAENCNECPKCDECTECPKCDETVIDNNKSGKYYILKNGHYVESKIGTQNIVRYASYYKTDSFTLFAYDKKLSLESNSKVYSDYVFNSRIVQFCDNLIGGVYIVLEDGTLYNFSIPYDLSKKLTKNDFENNLSKVNVKPIFKIIEMEVPSMLSGGDSYNIIVGYGHDGNYYELDSRVSDYEIYNDFSVY